MNLLHQGFQSWRLIDFLVVSFPPSVTILFSYWKRLVTYDFIFLAQYFKFWHIDYAFACALLHCLGGKSTFFSDKWGSFFFKLWLNLSSRLAIDRFFLSVGNFFFAQNNECSKFTFLYSRHRKSSFGRRCCQCRDIFW